MLSAYASFLFTVGKGGTLSLGVHPFAQTANGVQPWLHPIFFLAIGKPNQTEALIEFYRLSGRATYARRFEHALTLYNPEAHTDVDVPLGAAYVDPFDKTCAVRRTYTLHGQSGAVLLKAEALNSWSSESDVAGAGGGQAVEGAARRARTRRRRARARRRRV